jgi:hypothetical protein
MPRGLRLLAAGAVGAGATVAIDRVVTALDAERVPGWSRQNFRGRTVTLTGGAAAAAGATLASAVFAPAGPNRGGWKAAAVVAGLSAGVAGGYDDLIAPRWEQVGDKGWRGHLRALRAGRPTGGVVKVGTIGVGALVAGRMTSRSWAGAVPAGALIAGTANLVNLFDLRPGRAGKVVTALVASQLGGPCGPLAAATGGAALAELPLDLDETRMLGDIGANTLGALIGLRLAANGPWSRWVALGAVAAMTAASERVSFTEVIARHPPLRALDAWGRRSADAEVNEKSQLLPQRPSL